jgi:hypothetical protein
LSTGRINFEGVGLVGGISVHAEQGRACGLVREGSNGEGTIVVVRIRCQRTHGIKGNLSVHWNRCQQLLIGTVAENFECEGGYEFPWTLRSNNREWHLSGSLFRSDDGIGSVAVFSVAIGVDPSELVRRGCCLVNGLSAEENPDNEGQISCIGVSVTIGIAIHIARVQSTASWGGWHGDVCGFLDQ